MILGKTWMSMFLSWYLWSFLTHIVDSSKQSISWDQLGAICAPSRLGPTEDGGCPTAKPVHRSSLHHPTFRSFGYLSRYLSSFITVSKHRNQAFYINSRIYIHIYIFKLYICSLILYLSDLRMMKAFLNLVRIYCGRSWSIQIRPPGVETMPRRPAGCQVPSFFDAMRWPGKGGNTMARIAEKTAMILSMTNWMILR